jgi:hypothetical protein
MLERSQQFHDVSTSLRSPPHDLGALVPPRTLLARVRDGRLSGWLFVLPALAAYALFVLWPIVQTIRYSLYQWDGVLPAKWVGLDNFKTVFTDHQLLGILGHAFELMIFFSAVPVVLGLAVATVIRRIAARRIGSVACRRSCRSWPRESRGAGSSRRTASRTSSSPRSVSAE